MFGFSLNLEMLATEENKTHDFVRVKGLQATQADCRKRM